MLQGSPNKCGDFVFVYGQVGDAISPVAQLSVEEIFVACEEGWTALLKQERNYFVILHSASTDIETNLNRSHSPMLKELSLTGWKILVKHIHAGTISAENSSG